MKITTDHCVYAIIKHFYDKEVENRLLLRHYLWKRVSKSGTGNNIIRAFENKETGTIVKVQSSGSEIFNIYDVREKPTINGIKSYLREKLSQVDGWYELQYDAFDENNVVNWPEVKLPDLEGEDETFYEPLDMENFEYISVTEDELVICCGGDWIEPLTLTINLINGKLTVTHMESGYQEGMDEKNFIRAIQ